MKKRQPAATARSWSAACFLLVNNTGMQLVAEVEGKQAGLLPLKHVCIQRQFARIDRGRLAANCLMQFMKMKCSCGRKCKQADSSLPLAHALMRKQSPATAKSASVPNPCVSRRDTSRLIGCCWLMGKCRKQTLQQQAEAS